MTRSSRVVGCHPKLVILLNFGLVKDLDWVFLCRLSSTCAYNFCCWFVDRLPSVGVVVCSCVAQGDNEEQMCCCFQGKLVTQDGCCL